MKNPFKTKPAKDPDYDSEEARMARSTEAFLEFAGKNGMIDKHGNWKNHQPPPKKLQS